MTAVAPARRATWHSAYDAQMGLWRFLRSGHGQQYLARNFQINTRDLQPANREFQERLYANEEAKLLSADPFFVSAEMCEVVEAASASFRPEPLIPTDLLEPFGFIYYEKPFLVADRFDEPLQIAAISWMPLLDSRSFDQIVGGDGTHVSEIMAHLQTRYEANQAEGDGEDVKMVGDGLGLTIYATPDDSILSRPDIAWPPILLCHLTPWWFGMTFDGNDVDHLGKPTGAAWWWKIAQTTFRLMQQQISSRYPSRPDRATRRDGVRRGFHERDVVVVRLRRESSKNESDESVGGEANYSHRFIVSGHWRNQWYPSGQVHRQIWISPYVKGPEDQPLVVRPKRVYTWSR